MKLSGKVAIVTGASRGIGQSAAVKLSQEGSSVVLSDIQDTEETREIIVSKGGQAISVKCNVAESDEVHKLVLETEKKYGKIDILVNCAGVITISPVHKLSESEWDRIMGINAKGTFITNKAVIPSMMKRKYGKIVNVSSIAGKTGYGALSVYCASKFAVIGFTQALSKEMGAYNINVNAVCPGNIHTAMWDQIAGSDYVGLIYPSVGEKKPKGKDLVEIICKTSNPLGRTQSQEDIAAMIVFLVSDEAKNITGQAINVDAGQEVH
jgi:meso-butanediol dehydrogenase/(S,S)-butanediol dehydrogenase/diacetyl reductase